MHDVVVIGGGHNGLTCAAYLARAGKSVVVLEANERVGGLACTKELDDAPGFKINPGAMEFLTTGVSPSVVDELELSRYGLRWVYPQTLTTWLGPDGAQLSFWKDRARVVEEIKRFSRRDAANYERLCDAVTAALDAALPYFQGHPFRVRPKTVFEVLRRVANGRRNIGAGVRALTGSMESALEEYFERDEVKAPLGTYSLASWAPISEPGSGLYLSILTGAHEWGVRRPVGGTGAFSEALAACVRAHGGEVRLNTRVAGINDHGGRARGVTLESGEEIPAAQVVAAVDPTTLLARILDPAQVPLEVQEQLRGLQVSHHGIYLFKGDAALSRRPKYPGHSVTDEAAGVVGLCPSLDHLRKSVYTATVGDYEEIIPMYVSCPSIYDRTMVPPDSDGDNFYFYGFNAPYELSGGRDWADEKDRYWDCALDYFETVAPGTRDSVIAAELTAPSDFEGKFNVFRGNYSHADMTLAQLGPWRPLPALAGYRTPIEGLWHSGAGAFPMSYINGWAGRNTAREVLRCEPARRRGAPAASSNGHPGPAEPAPTRDELELRA